MELYFRVVIYTLTGIVGLCVGSFLNVVIYRVPENMSISTPPSHCPKCGYQLRFYDNVPVFSYIFLKGRCRKCSDKISPRYIIVEITNMLLWLLCLAGFENISYVYAACAAIACSVCICVFCIDIEHLIIFDRFQIILAVLAVVSIFFDTSVKWYSHLIGAAVSAAALLLIAFIAEKIYGREALGGGDIKFVIITGLYLGWQKLLLEVLISSISASIILIIIKHLRGDKKNKEYPFAPYLTVGFVISLLFGDAIISSYLSLVL